MGMFDMIIANCPECGEPSEFQTKSGPCVLATYNLSDAPEDVLADANRHSPNQCEKCGCYFKIDTLARKSTVLHSKGE